MHLDWRRLLTALLLIGLYPSAMASENLFENGNFEFPANGPNAIGWTLETEGGGMYFAQSSGLLDDGTGSARVVVSAPGDAVRLVSDCIRLPTPTVPAQYLVTVRHRSLSGDRVGSLDQRRFSDTSCQNGVGGSGISAGAGIRGHWDLVSRQAFGPGSIVITLSLSTNSNVSSEVLWDEVNVRLTNQIDQFRSQFLRQRSLNPFEDEADDDEFGSSITVGDFNGDGFDDAAIGAPLEDVVSNLNQGQVMVAFGSINGLNGNQDSQTITTTLNQSNQDFGRALAAGDFNCDGFDDLAVGAPLTNQTFFNVGAVFIYEGSATGLVLNSVRQIDRSNADIDGNVASGDAFGASLASGNFNGDFNTIMGNRACMDLAIGAPGIDVNGNDGAGGVFLLFGSINGLGINSTNTASRLWTQDRFQIVGLAEVDDNFGSAVMAFDVDDLVDDLFIGAPGDLSGSERGVVHFIPGVSGSELMDSFNSRIYIANTLGIAGLRYRDFGATLAGGIDYDNSAQLRGMAVGAPLTDIPAQFAIATGSVLRYDTIFSPAQAVLSLPSLQIDGNFGQQIVFADSQNHGLRGEFWVSQPGFNSGRGRIRLQGRDLVGNSIVPTSDFDLQDFGNQPGNGDRFGEVLARGNFNGYGGDELLIGIPFWNVFQLRSGSARGTIDGFNTGAVVEVSWDQTLPDPDSLFIDSFESAPTR